MRFGRIGQPGQEVPAVKHEGSWRDLRGITDEIDGAFLGRVGEVDWDSVLPTLPEVPAGRIGAPIAQPGKVVCIGLNYSDHAAESGMDEPTEPVLFMKDPSTVVGPDDTVLIPRKSVKTDWEVELAVVIGKEARYLPDAESAAAVIAGYAVAHDVSEREFQLERGGTWDKGKSCETFNPLGPELVTADEVGDPQNLDLKLSVNGTPRQNGNTANMIFGVYEIIRYLSQFMVLRPGDLINTGTPAGVAMGIDGQPYLRDGDVVELEIQGLGAQRQVMAQA